MSHAPVPDLCFYGLICFHLSSSPSSILFDLFSQPLLLLNNMVVLFMASFSLCNISLTCAFAYVRNEPQIYASFSMSASDCALV